MVAAGLTPGQEPAQAQEVTFIIFPSFLSYSLLLPLFTFRTPYSLILTSYSLYSLLFTLLAPLLLILYSLLLTS